MSAAPAKAVLQTWAATIMNIVESDACDFLWHIGPELPDGSGPGVGESCCEFLR